jgi:predicted acetyltransferase
VHHLTAKGDILPLMDEYFRQHIDRRYVTGTASLFLDPFVCDTYRSLIEALDRTGWLVMTVIRSQQRIIAFHFGYHYNGKLIWYKPSFDITEFKHSPGEVLLRELFEYAASTGCNEFDFTTGHEPFKDRFSNTTSANFIYEIYNTPDKTPKTEAPLNKRPRLIRRAGVILKKEGIKKGALKIWRIFLEKNFNHECVYLYTLPAAAPLLADIKPQLDNIIWRTADVKDLLRLDYFKNMDQKLEYYHTAFKRLTKGEQFKIVEQEGTIASFAWCARRDKTYIGEVETEMAFKEPAVVIYDCRTLPAHQNKNLYKFMLTMLINENPGMEKIIYCKKDNTPSRKGIESLFTLKLKLYYLRIFSLKLKWRG